MERMAGDLVAELGQYRHTADTRLSPAFGRRYIALRLKSKPDSVLVSEATPRRPTRTLQWLAKGFTGTSTLIHWRA